MTKQLNVSEFSLITDKIMSLLVGHKRARTATTEIILGFVLLAGWVNRVVLSLELVV